MKRICLSICTGAAALAFAAPVSAAILGPYLGLGVGQSIAKTPDGYAFNVSTLPGGSATHAHTGAAGRAFGGFNFNRYAGVELGYTRYARALYTGQAPGYYASMKYYFRTYDIVLKGYLPLGDSGFNLYGLLGYARVVGTLKYINNFGVPLSGTIATPQAKINHMWRNRPIYGLGANYTFAKHFTIGLEATEIYRMGSFSTSNTATPNLDLYTLNFAYNFC